MYRIIRHAKPHCTMRSLPKRYDLQHIKAHLTRVIHTTTHPDTGTFQTREIHTLPTPLPPPPPKKKTAHGISNSILGGWSRSLGTRWSGRPRKVIIKLHASEVRGLHVGALHCIKTNIDTINIYIQINEIEKN